MPVLHHSKFFTGRMPFLPPNQQRQSTEGTNTEGTCQHIINKKVNNNSNNTTATVFRPSRRSIYASRYLQCTEEVVGAKFYCPHALADGNQRICSREKTLEFSSLFPYLK